MPGQRTASSSGGTTTVVSDRPQCNVSCPGGGTTTITGKVYDPRRKNPLYNVAVYVPAAPLQPLPQGVPTGADACTCGALFQSGAVVNTTTAVDGTFTLTNVPVGATFRSSSRSASGAGRSTINDDGLPDNAPARQVARAPGHGRRGRHRTTTCPTSPSPRARPTRSSA